MAEVRFNLNEAFKRTFGVNPPFPGLLFPGQEVNPTYEKTASIQEGTIRIGDLTLIDGANRFEFTPSPVIEVTGVKNVVKTAIAGTDFTVKEIVSADDYKIRIRGFLFNTEFFEFSANGFSGRIRSREFPEEKLQELNNLYRLNKALTVENDYLRILSIERLVITGLTLPPVDGISGYFPYEIEAISDRYVELEIE